MANHPVLSFWVKFLITLCILAFMGGIERGRDAELQQVPNNTVATKWCDGGTHIVSVYEQVNTPGIYRIHCSDGVTVTGGRK